MGTYTTNLELYKPSVGEQGWGIMVNENFDKIDTASSVTGVVQLFAGSSAPSGWLICNGQTVSRTTYAALFAVIGTTYGAGNGSTTFNLPNLVNKTVRGSNSLGKTGGADTVTLTTSNMPAHTHGVGSLTTNNTGAHTHTVDFGTRSTVGSYAGGDYSAINSVNTSSNGNHTHTISGSTGSTGSGTSVDITNPYVMLHYIIKT